MPYPRVTVRRFALAACLVTGAVVVVPSAAFAGAPPRGARRAKAAVVAPPSPPPQVVFCDPQGDPRDPRFRVARKLRLEAGAYVPPTQSLTAGEAARDREKYLLLATQAVEGGYDAVNIYDRGVLSWGLMQWASHSNSLQEVLWQVKSGLLRRGRGKVWAELFKAHGLDVQPGPGGAPAFFVGGPTAWRPVVGVDDLRVLFRGTKVVGKYDPATVAKWAKVFARAGRNRRVQAVQVAWATQRLRDCLGERVDRGWSVGDFSRGDLFADALTFALWTNNPAACRAHFRQAVRQARLVTGEADPGKWPPGLFPLLWQEVARTSAFGMWPQRTARVEQLVPVGRVGRQRAVVELASRGWRLDALRRGGASGRLWRREPPPVAAAAAAAPRLPAPAAAKTAPKPAAPARNAAKFAPKPLPAPPTVAGPAAQPAAAPKPAAPVTPPANGAPPPMPIPRQQTPEGGAAAGTE